MIPLMQPTPDIAADIAACNAEEHAARKAAEARLLEALCTEPPQAAPPSDPLKSVGPGPLDGDHRCELCGEIIVGPCLNQSGLHACRTCLPEAERRLGGHVSAIIIYPTRAGA